MYDETIQRALKRHKIRPIRLPAPLCDTLVNNFRSENPISHIITGTAGDGKTYHCREVWNALGGSSDAWDRGDPIQTLALGDKTLVIVKDLSELRDEEGSSLIVQFANETVDPLAKRFYIIAANHGQLLEKLKSAPDTPEVRRISKVIEDLLVTGDSRDKGIKLNLDDLSRTPAAGIARAIIKEVTGHEGWSGCGVCEARSAGNICPIFENRKRLGEADEGSTFITRLISLIELSERNGAHFPVRQLLALAANSILGHPSPSVRDGLMTCNDVASIQAEGRIGDASIYRNIFGDNLKPSRAGKTELFRKLNVFGIGTETSNRIDDMLVYGADDPAYFQDYERLVLSDTIYGATPEYVSGQRRYLEGSEEGDRPSFLGSLRSQRQRLFFTLPDDKVREYSLWDLTVFRYGDLYLDVAAKVKTREPVPRSALNMIVRGLNRIFTGMLVQNQDELVIATSGSYSQSKQSPLLDDLIPVSRSGGKEVSIVDYSGTEGFSLSVKLVRGDDMHPISLPLSPNRFEFLGRVAEGALPNSFSLECHEDLLAFKARLLRETERIRSLDGEETFFDGELALRFIELTIDGRAQQRRVTVRL
jgi:hypothetical protein